MTLDFKQTNLLNNLLLDEKKIDKLLYSAGPYWRYKTKKIIYWLKKKGLKDFRGSDSGVGTSYTDNIVKDARNEFGYKGRLVSLITKLPIIKKIHKEQLLLTTNYIEALIKKNQSYYENHPRVNFLISNYKIKKSINFGCKSYFKYKDNDYSTHYLTMCDRMDNINKFVNLKKISSYFEIGGGFGSNVHLLIENFPNIKKIFYIDIVPNLFVGTEYLRSIYGEAVKDYDLMKDKKEISFLNTNELEIICLPPWKIKNIVSKVDHFHNAASLQEMTEIIVKNYFALISNILKKDSFSLIIYDDWKLNNTLSPETINKIFENKLQSKEFYSIDNKKQIYLIPNNNNI